MSNKNKQVKEVKQVKQELVVNAIINTVTSPATIQRLAEEHQLNPQEVFVRINFKVEGSDAEYQVSNKLRFLGQEGYKKLIEAKATRAAMPIKLVVGSKGALFYIEDTRQVDIEDLFKVPVTVEDNRKDVSELFGGSTTKKIKALDEEVTL